MARRLLFVALACLVVVEASESVAFESEAESGPSVFGDAQTNAQQQSQSQLQSQSSHSSSAPSTLAAVLLDTTELNALGWTKYPDGGPQTRTPGWVEESFTNFERGINWRSFVVCDVAYNSVNNWLWTPFIPRGEANRLYIETKFTMRDCNLFPQMVLSCKETFALLYKELDAPIAAQTAGQQFTATNGVSAASSAAANASFAQSDSFALIDAIAADEGRFTSNTDVVINTEIRSVPVSKRGVYFAFRDQGACLSLISIKVYHIACPAITSNLAHFNQTPTGRDLTSLVAVEGSCVANSMQVEQPRMFCSADGHWNSMSSGQCKCLAGFEAAANGSRCQACAPGRFKAAPGNELACQLCPERSSAPFAGSTECRCHEGFFRAPKDARSAPCSQPPSAPTNLSAIYVDSSSVILQWQPPRFTGARDDLTYKLLCDSCEPQTLVSSPQFYANFSETKCVLSGLSPATSYRFLVYAMNGVSQTAALQANVAPQYSEISVQTAPRQSAQAAGQAPVLAAGGSPLGVFNLRAIPGARSTDMIVAWDVQAWPAGAPPGSGGASAAAAPSAGEPADEPQPPSLYEVRFAPRYLSAPGASELLARRSPYPASLVSGPAADQQQQQQQQQSVTTSQRAVALNTLQPRTEYAFQIRAKWAHSGQWSELSEPIYMATTSQLAPPSPAYDAFAPASTGAFDPLAGERGAFLQAGLHPAFGPPPAGMQVASPAAGWPGALALFGFCFVLALAVGSLALLVQYRRTGHAICLKSLGAGFGQLGASSSTYGGVYGAGLGPLTGFGSPPAGFGSPHQTGARQHPFGAHQTPAGHHQQQQQQHLLQHHLGLGQHHATLSAGSAGGLITGSNATTRSSSGAANVVQNFIAATLGQISPSKAARQQQQQLQQQALDDKLFASPIIGGPPLQMGAPNQHQALVPTANHNHLRNHYHQTLGLGPQAQARFQQHVNNGAAAYQLQPAGADSQLSAQPTIDELLKYRTLGQPGAGSYLQHAQDPQMHIYDDLDTSTCQSAAMAHHGAIVGANSQAGGHLAEIEPSQVSIESVIGRGEFGDVCVARLRSPESEHAERRVAVRRLKTAASERARLALLVEAAIMSQLDHPNIVRLEGVVSRKEPAMLVTELMERGALDQYLRDNKGRFSGAQLISMLRGVASGMHYLGQQHYVHKDLAARNILVDARDVCKIADFGLAARQRAHAAPSSRDSAATDSASSNSLSSATTASTLSTANLTSLALQIAQQRLRANDETPREGERERENDNDKEAAQSAKIPVRWTALEAIAFRRFSCASDVWSFGVVCWEVMTQGERPFWNWSNQDVIKALEQGYRLPQPDNCPDHLYKLMLNCWLKDRAARPTFGQILKALGAPSAGLYEDPFAGAQLAATQPPQSSSQETATYYDAYNPISQLISRPAHNEPLSAAFQPAGAKASAAEPASVDEWLASIKMSRYSDNFQRHQIGSLQYAARLSQADLTLIGVQNPQHLKRLLQAIASLRSAASIGASAEGYLV